MGHNRLSRRTFLMGSAAAATLAGCATARRPKLCKMGYRSPNEKLNVAGIGVGGKGSSDVGGCDSENIVALCDVDWNRASRTFADYPNAKKYKDFRDMLDKEGANIDACTVSTADHCHAVAAMACMERGIHVYVQKPLTRTVHEARALTEAAQKYNVATQMGNQGHSGNDVRVFCEMIWSGIIGRVREVHAWTNRPIWPQGIPEPLPKEPIPEEMNWDLWLGPSPWRPYNSNYAPFKWRGWYDFGTGALGDMACHICDPANWALQLKYPTSVECIYQSGKNDQTAPESSIIRFEFPERGAMPPASLTWYDGGKFPPRGKYGIPDDIKLGDGDNGSLFIGDEGMITIGTYGGNPRLLPGSKHMDAKKPGQMLPRSPGHYQEWIQACKGGPSSPGSFDYAGPFTEWVLLGVVSLRAEGKLLWDGPNMRFTNSSKANDLVEVDYRRGWSL